MRILPFTGKTVIELTSGNVIEVWPYPRSGDTSMLLRSRSQEWTVCLDLSPAERSALAAALALPAPKEARG